MSTTNRTFLPLAVVAIAVVAFGATLDAAIITITKGQPYRATQGDYNVASQGTYDFGTSPFPTDAGVAIMNTGIYQQSLTGLTVEGATGIGLSWDLRVTANDGSGVWSKNNYAVVTPPNDTNNRIEGDETLTWSIENLDMTGAPSGYTASFDGFTAMEASLGSATVTLGDTAVIAEGNGSTYATSVDYGFAIVPNLDVDVTDYIALKTHMGQATSAGATEGDFDLDNDVDWDDLQILQDRFREQNAANANPIPEPATLLIMLAAGLPALLKRRRS